MTKFVPYLSEEVIERDAAALLAEYAQARGVTVKPPIPIEDIVEKHLKLRFEFDDTHKLFGIPRDPKCDADILGAIFFDEARIVIDESLDPEENPLMEGRYRFTLAHEAVGHWRLHRHLFAKDPAQAFLFGGRAAPSFVCCSAGRNLSFNWRLILAPDFVLRYLVTHETVHLAVPDHSAKFWLTVQSLCPETERAKQWLSANGLRLAVKLDSICDETDPTGRHSRASLRRGPGPSGA
jgi:Protein of unknown function DUF45